MASFLFRPRRSVAIRVGGVFLRCPEPIRRLKRVSQRRWQGSGSKYTLSWGNQPWTLELEADRPGMRSVDRPADCVLALDGVAAVSRFDPAALTGKSLVRVERLAHRVEATYTPRGGAVWKCGRAGVRHHGTTGSTWRSRSRHRRSAS